MGGKVRTTALILIFSLVGVGLGHAWAHYAEHDNSSPGGQNAESESGFEGYYDAYYDKGYQRGWREGYDEGYQDGWNAFPPSPDHSLTFDEAEAMAVRVAVRIATDIARDYQPSHPYRADVFDCNDIAEELWNIYQDEEIRSYIVIGCKNLTGESFHDCNHSWIVVFCFDETSEYEYTLAVDPTVPVIGVVGEPMTLTEYVMESDEFMRALTGVQYLDEQYGEGYFYSNPADVRQDLRARW